MVTMRTDERKCFFCFLLIFFHLFTRHTNVRQLYTSYASKLVPKEEAERFMKIMPL